MKLFKVTLTKRSVDQEVLPFNAEYNILAPTLIAAHAEAIRLYEAKSGPLKRIAHTDFDQIFVEVVLSEVYLYKN